MGAAVGEILAAVRDIRDGDPRTWPPAFAALGDQTRSVAHSVLHKHPVSARDHFQRASMYYRAAEYYDDPVTETSRAHGLASRDAFLEAAKLMPWKSEVLQIPFEALAARLFHAAGLYRSSAPQDCHPSDRL